MLRTIKTLIKEINKDLNKWKSVLCSWIKKSTQEECQFSPKLSVV